ncbi:MAG: ArsC/Spx/MgsR family protein [Nitrospirales bacterium]
MEKLIIYQKPTCSTCRQVIKLAEASGKPYEAINYYEKPFSKAKLKGLLKKGEISAKEILRTKEDIYKIRKAEIVTMKEDDLIALMIEHPDLIQRPLVEKGEQVIMARPPETLHNIL